MSTQQVIFLSDVSLKQPQVFYFLGYHKKLGVPETCICHHKYPPIIPIKGPPSNILKSRSQKIDPWCGVNVIFLQTEGTLNPQSWPKGSGLEQKTIKSAILPRKCYQNPPPLQECWILGKYPSNSNQNE